MPLYPNANILLVHIPKTGGTSVHTYFKARDPWCITASPVHEHHATLAEYMSFERTRQTITESHRMTKLAIVRNPYHRLLSELFWRGKRGYAHGVSPQTASALANDHGAMYQALMEAARGFLESPVITTDDVRMTERRRLPQVDYLTIDPARREVDFDGMHILRTETLADDMSALGFCDFAQIGVHNRNPVPFDIRYDDYLYGPLRAMIHEHYKRDFVAFGYPA